MDTAVGYDEDEDEEEDEDEDAEGDSGLYCANCHSEISMAEEIFLLRVVQPIHAENGVQYLDVLDADGDYTYAPAFFCFDCWEETQEELQELLEDSPPFADDDGIIECDICRGDVLLEESVALVHFGELHWSKRAPNGNPTPVFVEMQKDIHVCTSCLKHMEDGRREPLWDIDVEPKPGLQVCRDGLFEKCWRYGTCTCHKHAGDE